MSLRNDLRKNTWRGDLARQWAEAQGVRIEDLLKSERWSKMVDGSNAPSLIILLVLSITGVVIFHESLWTVLVICAVNIVAFVVFTNVVMRKWLPRSELYWKFCMDLRELEKNLGTQLTQKNGSIKYVSRYINTRLNELAEDIQRAQTLMVFHGQGTPDYDKIGDEVHCRERQTVKFDNFLAAGKKFGFVEGKGTYFNRARTRLDTMTPK